ncbi:MAG: hypothetical protein JRE45_13015 [Deltaproteobacteria bacterium]|nr:hypothetical protein [Deltaproteobacteria bacterium]
MLRFLQTAPLLLALSHFGTRESHSNDPTDAQEKGSRAGDNSRSAEERSNRSGLIVSEIPARDHSPCCTRRTETEDNGGPDEPTPRLLHTKIHLLERVPVWCPWKAWCNVNTGRG